MFLCIRSRFPLQGRKRFRSQLLWLASGERDEAHCDADELVLLVLLINASSSQSSCSSINGAASGVDSLFSQMEEHPDPARFPELLERNFQNLLSRSSCFFSFSFAFARTAAPQMRGGAEIHRRRVWLAASRSPGHASSRKVFLFTQLSAAVSSQAS